MNPLQQKQTFTEVFGRDYNHKTVTSFKEDYSKSCAFGDLISNTQSLILAERIISEKPDTPKCFCKLVAKVVGNGRNNILTIAGVPGHKGVVKVVSNDKRIAFFNFDRFVKDKDEQSLVFTASG